MLQLSSAGVPGLTHRKVEQRAGLAQGSVKYYFGSSDALVEGILQHLADQSLPLVLTVSPAEREAAEKGAGEILLRHAQQVAKEMLAQPDYVRARLHLYLHAAGHPRWQALVTAARDRLVAQVAESLPGPSSAAAARFVCAVVDGILLDQVSAPSRTVERFAGRYLLAAGGAAATIAVEQEA